jgi:hypothetical protein
MRVVRFKIPEDLLSSNSTDPPIFDMLPTSSVFFSTKMVTLYIKLPFHLRSVHALRTFRFLI